MKPHKHAELIKAWADGAEIQLLDDNGIWMDFREGDTPAWNPEYKYRVKPQPKSDVRKSFFAHGNYHFQGMHISARNDEVHNLILTFSGETGELKSAEVL